MSVRSGLVDVVMPRLVPLGESDGLTVRRTLPTHHKSLIGAWCFIDHFGPDDVSHSGMQVPPHPHTGLQTASWLFSGSIEHRDSAGNHLFIRPGELNLMTAGRGISHSEMSVVGSDVLRGVQLWIALPDATRFCEPTFEHFVPDLHQLEAVSIQVFVGELAGISSPAFTHTKLLGAEITLDEACNWSVELEQDFEHGVLVDKGSVRINGELVAEHELAYLPTGTGRLNIEAESATRLVVLGGEPLGESIVMWWNFIGRTHEEIADFRQQWNDEISGQTSEKLFGHPVADPLSPLEAPDLPAGRLKLRS